MFALFRDRNFVLWWLGGRISIMGDYILIAALPFYVFSVSKSVPATALIFMAQMLPPIVLGSVVGVYVDRWDRRRTMIMAELVLATVLLPLLAVRSGPSIWIVPLAAMAEAAAFQFVPPAASALIPAIVSRERLAPANALLAIGTNLAVLIGPPAGALVLHALGLSGVVLFDVASYLFAAATVSLVTVQPEAVVKPGTDDTARVASFWREWIEGLHLIRSKRWIAGLFAMEATTMFGGGMIWVVSIVFIERILHQGALQYGWWLSLSAVGGIVGSFVMGYIAPRLPPSRLIAAGCIIDGLIWLVVVRFQTLPVLLALAPLGAIGGTFWSVSAQTMLQTDIADQYLGRIFGAYGAIASLAVLLGLGVASVLGGVVGIALLLGVAGSLSVVAGLIALVLLPGAASGRRSDAIEDSHPLQL